MLCCVFCFFFLIIIIIICVCVAVRKERLTQQKDKQLGGGEEEGEEQSTPVKYVPCNTVEKLCPLPRSQHRTAPSPQCELLGSSRARRGAWPCSVHQSCFCFLAQAPPDGRPVHTAQNLPGCAPAGGTQPHGRWALMGPFAAGDWQHPWVGGRAASSA